MVSVQMLKMCLSFMFLVSSSYAIDWFTPVDPNQYLILQRSNCRGQDLTNPAPIVFDDRETCIQKCKTNPECKSFTIDYTANQCKFKKACDDKQHQNGFTSYVSTESFRGPALPRHYVTSILNDKVLTVGQIIDANGAYQLTFEAKRSPPHKNQRFYAEPLEDTFEFRIRWDGDPKLVVDIKGASTNRGTPIVLYKYDENNAKSNQLWHWKGRTLESKSKEGLVLQVDYNRDVVTADLKGGKENQEFIFEG